MKFLLIIIAVAGLGYAVYLDKIVTPELQAQVADLQEKNTDLEQQVATLQKAATAASKAASNSSAATPAAPAAQPAAQVTPPVQPTAPTAPAPVAAAPAPAQTSPMPAAAETATPATDPASNRAALELQIQELNTQYDLQMSEFRTRKQRLGSEIADMQWKRDSAVNTMKDQISALENNNGSGLRMSKADIPRRVAALKEDAGKQVDAMEFEIKKKTDELSTLESDRIRYEGDAQTKLNALRAQMRAL